MPRKPTREQLEFPERAKPKKPERQHPIIGKLVTRSALKKFDNFTGTEGVDYSVVFYGGFKEHSEAETDTDAFQITDLARLSHRSQDPDSDYYRYANEAKVSLLRDRLTPYVGHYVRMRVIGRQIAESGKSTRFVLPDDLKLQPESGFFLGSAEEFGQAYMEMLRSFLEQAQFSGQEYGRTTVVSEIWIAYAKPGQQLPKDSQYGHREEEAEPVPPQPSKRAGTRTKKRAKKATTRTKTRKPAPSRTARAGKKSKGTKKSRTTGSKKGPTRTSRTPFSSKGKKAGGGSGRPKRGKSPHTKRKKGR